MCACHPTPADTAPPPLIPEVAPAAPPGGDDDDDDDGPTSVGILAALLATFAPHHESHTIH